MNSMKPWKDLMQNILYLHYRILVLLLLFAGGAVALWAVYIFLLTAASVSPVAEQSDGTKIDQEALQRVLTWNKKKQERSLGAISVPDSAFIIPSPVP